MVAHIFRNDYIHVIVHKNYSQNNNYSQEYIVESAYSHKNNSPCTHDYFQRKDRFNHSQDTNLSFKHAIISLHLTEKNLNN